MKEDYKEQRTKLQSLVKLSSLLLVWTVILVALLISAQVILLLSIYYYDINGTILNVIRGFNLLVSIIIILITSIRWYTINRIQTVLCDWREYISELQKKIRGEL